MNVITPVLPGPVSVAGTDPIPTPVQTGAAPVGPPPAASPAQVQAFLNAPIVVSRVQDPARLFPLLTPGQNHARANLVPAIAARTCSRRLPDDISPPGRAAPTGNLELFQVLLGAGCNANWIEKGTAHGYTPLVAQIASQAKKDEAPPMLFQIQAIQLRQYVEQWQQA